MSTGGGAGYSPESVRPDQSGTDKSLLDKIKSAIKPHSSSPSYRRPEGEGSQANRPQEGVPAAAPENLEDLIPDGQKHAALEGTYHYEERAYPGSASSQQQQQQQQQQGADGTRPQGESAAAGTGGFTGILRRMTGGRRSSIGGLSHDVDPASKQGTGSAFGRSRGASIDIRRDGPPAQGLGDMAHAEADNTPRLRGSSDRSAPGYAP